MTILKTQLAVSQLAYEKLAGDTSKSKPVLSVREVVTKTCLNTKKLRVKHLECDCATVAEKGQQILDEYWETGRQ